MEELRKTEGKRLFGRPGHRWEGNIKMNVIEIVSECTDWIRLAQDRDQWRDLVKMVMKFYLHKRQGIM
jgi:hypothetical protein